MKVHNSGDKIPITGEGNHIKHNRNEGIPNKPNTGHNDPSDKVTITEFGANLQSLIGSLAQVSAIDIKRIEKIKAAIESGEFTIDKKSVAEKLVDSEQKL